MKKTIFYINSGTEELSFDSDSFFHFDELVFKDEIPKPRTNYLTVPGADGTVDLSDFPLGYPVYDDRNVYWKFSVKTSEPNWKEKIDSFVQKLLGRKIEFLHQGDEYRYVGRINEIKQDVGGVVKVLEVKAICEPFKYRIGVTGDNAGRGYNNIVIPTVYDESISIKIPDFSFGRSYFEIRTGVRITVKTQSGKEATFDSRGGDNWWTDSMFEVNPNSTIFLVKSTTANRNLFYRWKVLSLS